MSFILWIFLGVLLWWTIRIVAGLIQARRQFRQFFSRAADNSAATDPTRNHERKGGWSSPMRRRKKIDSTVGEYVKFTETEVTIKATRENSNNGASQKVVTEEQISDVEWEELPH